MKVADMIVKAVKVGSIEGTAGPVTERLETDNYASVKCHGD